MCLIRNFIFIKKSQTNKCFDIDIAILTPRNIENQINFENYMIPAATCTTDR